jgi:hypothetical protein
MTEQEFIKRLKEVPFAADQYTHLGVSETFTARTIDGYNPKRKNSAQNAFSDDPLVQLVNDYDVTRTEIGMISFESEVKESEDYYYVGRFETDFLCVAKVSKEVVILRFDDPSSVMYICAQNSGVFLEVMIFAAKYLEKRMIEQLDNSHIDCSMAENCSELAGGARYLDFYKVLLGCQS